MSWPQVAIKDVADVISGATPKSKVAEYWGDDVRWATPTDLSKNEGAYLKETARRITHAGLQSCAAQILPPRSVLMSSRAPIGLVAINTEPMATNQGFKSLVPDRSRVFEGYLYHWLAANTSYLQSLGNGATFKEVSKAVVQRIEIPLPPLEEQRRIAGILDAADALRRRRSKALALLDTLPGAIFAEMFGDPVSNPKGLPKVKLGELIKVSSGEGLTAKKMSGGKYPVYGGNGINGWHNEGRYQPGTIVIGRVGVYCGAVQLTQQTAWITDNALAVTKKTSIETEYLAAALKFADLNQYAGRSAQPLVSGSRIYPVSILVPDADLQKRYTSTIFQVKSRERQMTAHLTQLETLFASLQSRAFAGEL